MKEERLLRMSVILIDKPAGPASFGVVEEVCKILSVPVAGHAGTLDPNATGLLLIALGEARKAMPVLAGLDKEYVGTMLLHGDIPEEKVRDALSSFRGRIKQMPPVKSAVARRERERTVHELEVIAIDGRKVTMRVLCEAGTYMRKIASDCGEKLGCGAHLAQLRRTRVGPFDVEDALTLEALKRKGSEVPKKSLITLEEALLRIGLPRMTVSDESVEKIRKGSPVRKEFVASVSGKPVLGGYLGVYDASGKIVCLGKFSGEGNTAAKTERVFLR
jgi:H/ACA ribonucleoprotein complex subunit 4